MTRENIQRGGISAGQPACGGRDYKGDCGKDHTALTRGVIVSLQVSAINRNTNATTRIVTRLSGAVARKQR